MKIFISILLCFISNEIFCYISLQVDGINQFVDNNRKSKTYKKVYADFPLNYSELNSINEPFVSINDINYELYTASIYLGSYKQNFRLLISTTDDYITVSSINCTSCNVSNKYNYLFSDTNIKINQLDKKTKSNKKFNYEIFQDSCHISSQSIINDINENMIINIPNLHFKVIELDSSGFLNSNLIDGILGLKYNNDTNQPNKNIIRELYNEGYISSPSFSIIITSSNVNRLYLGDIMKNEYIKNYLNSEMNKGECKIIDNNWKCQINRLEYNALSLFMWDKHKIWDNSILSFDLKDNRLTIPEKYYDLLVKGYRRKGLGREYHKFCRKYGKEIYCSCHDKDYFGIVTFHFGNNSKLEIDLRNYVTFDKRAFLFKCKFDVNLSKKSEFIIGLRGLNNTILSFNMEEKKIKIFHKIKTAFKKKFKNIKLIITIASIIIYVLVLILFYALK